MIVATLQSTTQAVVHSYLVCLCLSKKYLLHCCGTVCKIEGVCMDIVYNQCGAVARICCKEGQSWKLGHGALTVDFRAGCSS